MKKWTQYIRFFEYEVPLGKPPLELVKFSSKEIFERANYVELREGTEFINAERLTKSASPGLTLHWDKSKVKENREERLLVITRVGEDWVPDVGHYEREDKPNYNFVLLQKDIDGSFSLYEIVLDWEEYENRTK